MKFEYRNFFFTVLSGLIALPVIAKEGDAHAQAITNIEHTHWINKLNMNGVLEFELGRSENFSGVDESDGVLATVELGFDTEINERISASIALLFEEDDTDLEIDEGVIHISLADNYSITMGQMYIPFGSFETNMVSDPLTLEIGEARESAVVVNFEHGGVRGSLFIDNGELRETARERIDQFGFSLGYRADRDSGLSYDIGFDYANNIGDSKNIAGIVQGNNGGNVRMVNYVGAYILHADITLGEFAIIAEYLASTDQFDVTEMGFNGNGAEPEALNIEVAFSTQLAGMPASWAVGYQASEEAIDLELPRRKLLVALSLEVMRDAALSFEITRSDDYSIADSGSGAVAGTGNSATAFVAQFAVGF